MTQLAKLKVLVKVDAPHLAKSKHSSLGSWIFDSLLDFFSILKLVVDQCHLVGLLHLVLLGTEQTLVGLLLGANLHILGQLKLIHHLLRLVMLLGFQEHRLLLGLAQELLLLRARHLEQLWLDFRLGKFFHDSIDVGSDPVCSSQISIEVKEAHLLQLAQ